MKKILLPLLLVPVLLFSSCDLFMPYEKPSLYVVTVGLGYNCSKGNLLPNTRNDANCFEDLMTGLADQAGMDWYSVSYRDSYPIEDSFCNGGTAVIDLTSSNESVTALYTIDFNKLLWKENESLFLRNKIEDILFDTPGVKTPGDNDILIFYYAGHGSKPKGHLWIVPPITPIQTPGKENRECYWMLDDLTDTNGLLMDFPGRRAVVLDSCFSGNIIEDNRNDIGMGEVGGDGIYVPGHGENPYDPDWWWNKDRRHEERPVAVHGVQEGKGRSVPEIFLVTSASGSQTAADGEEGSNSPFMEAFISFVQPGFQHGDPVNTARKRIFLSDIYKVAKKAMMSLNQDPQTLLTRYDLTLFDFTR